MESKVIDQAKLTELMNNGWSWHTTVNGAAISTEILVDPATGKKFKLHVYDGELTMTEVTV